jgi:hypothetical protein
MAQRKAAAITRLPSRAGQVRITRKGCDAGQRVLRRDDTGKPVRKAEIPVDQGLPPNRSSVSRLHRPGALVARPVADIRAAGKPPRRGKAAILGTLGCDLGMERTGHPDHQKRVKDGRKPADQGAGRYRKGKGFRPCLGPLPWREPDAAQPSAAAWPMDRRGGIRAGPPLG